MLLQKLPSALSGGKWCFQYGTGFSCSTAGMCGLHSDTVLRLARKCDKAGYLGTHQHICNASAWEAEVGW